MIYEGETMSVAPIKYSIIGDKSVVYIINEKKTVVLNKTSTAIFKFLCSSDESDSSIDASDIIDMLCLRYSMDLADRSRVAADIKSVMKQFRQIGLLITN